MTMPPGRPPGFVPVHEMRWLKLHGVLDAAESAEVVQLWSATTTRFEDIFEQMFGQGRPAQTDLALAGAGNAELIEKLTDTITNLNDKVERLAKSNENGEALAKLNTLLQFLAVLLTIVMMMQARGQAPRAVPAEPLPSPTGVTRVIEPSAPPAIPSPRPQDPPMGQQ